MQRSQISRMAAALCAVCLCAQRAHAAASDWNVHVWQPNDAAPNTNIVGMSQTHDGYLWVGSTNGLARFDGVKFEQAPLKQFWDDPIRIGALCQTHDGALVMAMSSGSVIRFHFGSSPEVIRELPKMTPASIVEDKTGAIWVGYREGSVCRIYQGKITPFSATDGLPEKGSDCSLCEDFAGQIWCSRGNQAGVFRDGHFEVLASFPDSDWVELAPAKHGGAWMVAGFALYRYNEQGELENRGTFKPLFFNGRALVVREDRGGAVWIGTSEDGLLRYDDKRIERIPISHHRITNLLEDSEGNMWVGTGGGGLNCVRPRAIALEGSAAGFTTDMVMSMCEDASGNLWAAMQDGSLKVRRDGRGWTRPDSSEHWTGDPAMCVASDRDSALWVGTSKGRLLRLEGERVTAWNRGEDGLAGASISKLLPAKNGDLWLAERSPDVLQRLSNGKFETFRLSLTGDRIRSLAEDTAGAIWIASEGGKLWRATGETIVNETAQLPHPFGGILCLYSGPDGALWIGTRSGGVIRLKNGKAAAISDERGLYDHSIAQIIPDDRGWMWFGSSKGIFKVRQQEFDDVAERTEDRVRSMHYGEEEGLPILHATAPRSNAVRTKDGHLWLIMGPALATISPEKDREQMHPPPVILEKVTVLAAKCFSCRRITAACGSILPR